MPKVIITGLGRCGTSVLTKYIQDVGFSLGNRVSWNKDMRAGLELSPAYSLNRNMFLRYLNHNKKDIYWRNVNIDDACPGGFWEKFTFREAINDIFESKKQREYGLVHYGHVDVIKDPRFTWHPYLIQAWWEARQDFSIIICHRKIENIYKSRKSMRPHEDDPKRKTDPANPEVEIPMYKNDFADFITKVIELSIPHKFLFFPNFLNNFDEVWNTLCSVGLKHDYKKGKEKWEKLINLDHVTIS